MNQIATPDRPLSEAERPDIFAYEAPFVIERLLKNGVVESPEEGEFLFREFKRWMQITASDRSRLWPIFSLQIDEVWHAFILYTREYTAFCNQHFGRYVHHTPNNAPRFPEQEEKEIASFDTFSARYESAFGEPPPALWHSTTDVGLHRRILNPEAGHLSIRANDLMLQITNPDARQCLVQDENQTFHLVNARGAEILRTGTIAGAALEFIAGTPSFYVRELPGNLAPEEKIELITTLVSSRLLQIVF